MPRYPHALALGLMRLPPDATSADLTEARVGLALLAVRHGYALVETVEAGHAPTTHTPDDVRSIVTLGAPEGCPHPETPHSPPSTHTTPLDEALGAVERLAIRLDVDALAVTGDLDDERVEDLAARVRLVVLRHPGPDRRAALSPDRSASATPDRSTRDKPGDT